MYLVDRRSDVCRQHKFGTHHEGVEVDEDQAGSHHQVCYQWERSKVLQVGCEDQQNEGGQEAEHIEPGVKAVHQDLGLIGLVNMAVKGGGVGRLHHLVREENSFVHVRKLILCISRIFLQMGI